MQCYAPVDELRDSGAHTRSTSHNVAFDNFFKQNTF